MPSHKWISHGRRREETESPLSGGRRNGEGMNLRLLLPLLDCLLNHVSFLCKSLSKSIIFYEQILDFALIQRPASLFYKWLVKYGLGIHLLQSERAPEGGGLINPRDNHISFQCSNMKLVMQKLVDYGIDYVTAVVEDGGIEVDQLFFHDPDGYMVEICNRHNVPVLPLKPPISDSRAPLSVSPPDFYGTLLLLPHHQMGCLKNDFLLHKFNDPIHTKQKAGKQSASSDDGNLVGGHAFQSEH